MDLSAIIDEFNRRKAQAGQRISDMFTPPKKPADWFQQMQQGQNAVVTPEQRSNVNKELADMLERFTAGVVPEPIRARERAMRTDPSAAAKPFTSEEVKGMTPYVTAAAPIAYHGTPHTFDKFDASKIGTGQGAQSYGHGLYFAENPAVAKEYAEGFARHEMTLRDKAGNIIAQGKNITPEMFEATKYLGAATEAGKPSASAISEFTGKPEVLNELKNLVAKGASRTYEKVPGNQYQVNIPDEHAARMLDWDKPLSEQSDFVKSALAKLGITASEAGAKEGTGQTILRGLGGDQYASNMLKEAGIPGIKYLDQGSRTAGQGTRNFVVFDPAILEDVTRK